MKDWWFRSRTFWIMPLVILVVALLEEVATYKARQHVHEVYVRVAVILALNAFGFSVAAGWIAPRMTQLFSHARRKSVHAGGGIGLWVFYILAYGAIFLAYLTIERHGIGGLLPASLR